MYMETTLKMALHERNFIFLTPLNTVFYELCGFVGQTIFRFGHF